MAQYNTFYIPMADDGTNAERLVEAFPDLWTSKER